MKPHERKENEALYKRRRFKTIGAFMNAHPGERFLERIAGWVNGIKRRNRRNKYNCRPSLSKRTEGRFAQLKAFKFTHGLV